MSMVEEAAKALCADNSSVPEDIDQIWEGVGEITKQRFRGQANLVINVVLKKIEEVYAPVDPPVHIRRVFATRFGHA